MIHLSVVRLEMQKAMRLAGMANRRTLLNLPADLLSGRSIACVVPNLLKRLFEDMLKASNETPAKASVQSE